MIRKFNEHIDSDTLTLTPAQLKVFVRRHTHPDFPGLEYESETSEGDYDSEKGSMLDYPIYLVDSKTGANVWEGSGGYYNGPSGESHSYPITFHRHIEKKKVFRVIFEGFETESQAKSFAAWYEGSGEQDSCNWLESDRKCDIKNANVDMDKYHKQGGFKANDGDIIVPLKLYKK